MTETSSRMRPLAKLLEEAAAEVTVVLTDIDDTLTTDGRMPALAYRALEDLAVAGIAVAPITGRPAGWCDMIARLWPVRGVVGENGAFYFAYDEGARRMRRSYTLPEETRADDRAGLERIRERVLREVPGAAVSADQFCRAADLAIDFCEDVPPLPPDVVQRIKTIFEEEGATAKISSIHVNGWFGAYDKLTATRRFAAEVLGLDLDRDKGRVVFVGDSPNDAPMFGFFPLSCGVANVRDFAGRLDAEPAYVTPSRGGAGFAEVAAHILRARRGAQ